MKYESQKLKDLYQRFLIEKCLLLYVLSEEGGYIEITIRIMKLNGGKAILYDFSKSRYRNYNFYNS